MLQYAAAVAPPVVVDEQECVDATVLTSAPTAGMISELATTACGSAVSGSVAFKIHPGYRNLGVSTRYRFPAAHEV